MGNVPQLPTLFISHGSPLIMIEDCPARRFLTELGKTLERPKAILVTSAHWETTGHPAVNLATKPETIHDFGGFPQALYEIRYPAPGAPEVAEAAARLLEQAGFAVKRDPSRGLDHGAWVPLSLMYPAADIPVAQLSLVRGAGPAEHYRLGAALRPLRAQDVLIMGSGSLTHNLGELWGNPLAAPIPAWVSAFGEWIADQLKQSRLEALLDYREQAPYAMRNHPTEEHLLPLFVAMGAAGEPFSAKRVHTSHTYGVLAMDAYAFSEAINLLQTERSPHP